MQPLKRERRANDILSILSGERIVNLFCFANRLAGFTSDKDGVSGAVGRGGRGVKRDGIRDLYFFIFNRVNFFFFISLF